MNHNESNLRISLRDLKYSKPPCILRCLFWTDYSFFFSIFFWRANQMTSWIEIIGGTIIDSTSMRPAKFVKSAILGVVGPLRSELVSMLSSHEFTAAMTPRQKRKRHWFGCSSICIRCGTKTCCFLNDWSNNFIGRTQVCSAAFWR